jgi:hypothetical protein
MGWRSADKTARPELARDGEQAAVRVGGASKAASLALPVDQAATGAQRGERALQECDGWNSGK